MAEFTGRSPVFWRTTFSAAIPFWIQTRWERFSISPFWGHFVTTSGSLPTALNHGPVSRGQAAGTSSGLQLIGAPGQATDFNTSFGRSLLLAHSVDSAVPPTVV